MFILLQIHDYDNCIMTLTTQIQRDYSINIELNFYPLNIASNQTIPPEKHRVWRVNEIFRFSNSKKSRAMTSTPQTKHIVGILTK